MTGAEDKRLKVLFINDTARNGGPGRTILYILKFLDPKHVHRSLMLPREGIVSRRIVAAGAAEALFFEPGLIEHPFEPLRRPMERRDYDAIWPVKLGRSLANGFRILAGIVRLWRRIRAERFDLIFCNGTSAGFLTGALANLTRTPAIWHVVYPSVAAPVRPLHRLLARSRYVKRIVCISDATTGQFDHCRAKVRKIPTALDIEEFDAQAAAPALRAEMRLAADVVIFGSCGRILPRKGYIEMIRAAKIVLDRLDAAERARCRFVVLGDTPQDLTPDHLEQCRTLVRALSLEEWVHFIGFRPDVRPFVADFDVSVVPSIYDDPLPRSVMETMAMGKPVAAFANGGISEMIAGGTEGILVKGRPPDIEGLAEACLAYFRDPALRARHGAAARARVERDFDAHRQARQLTAEMVGVVRQLS